MIQEYYLSPESEFWGRNSRVCKRCFRFLLLFTGLMIEPGWYIWPRVDETEQTEPGYKQKALITPLIVLTIM